MVSIYAFKTLSTAFLTNIVLFTILNIYLKVEMSLGKLIYLFMFVITFTIAFPLTQSILAIFVFYLVNRLFKLI